MSFLVAAALAVAALIFVPVVAHLLRRSRAEEREFPPAKLVPIASPVARQRSRLEDRALLGVRALLILGLAVLGATPLVRCERLSLARNSGASVALGLVIDDSQSMRAQLPSGKTRFDAALKGARELLAATREGDAVAIVCGGAPARLILAATTDLEIAKRTLDALEPSDRATDLSSAVQLARSSIKQLPQIDHRVVLLSDLAAPAPPDGNPPAWAPLAELRTHVDDCGIVGAESRGKRVAVTVACSSGRAAEKRSVELVVGTGEVGDAGAENPAGKRGEVLKNAKLDPRVGTQTVSIEIDTLALGLDARLTGSDRIASDDIAPVARESASLVVGVVTDQATASGNTGGPPILEQALEALGLDITRKPLSVVPDDEKELAPFAAMVLDDPSGLGPEARGVLVSWIEKGGVAAAWLGRSAEIGELGATLEPFVSSSVHWETTTQKGIDPASVGWLGAAGTSLADIAPRGRARLEGAIPSGAEVIARWSDGQPFILSTPRGRGLVLAIGLPVSAEESDVALRPGFLALLEHVVDQAQRRSGPRRTEAGVAWSFPGQNVLEIEGPEGPLRVGETSADGTKTFVPANTGRYRVKTENGTEARVVTLNEQELVDSPREPDAKEKGVVVGGVETRIDASSDLAWILLALFVFELGLRALSRLAPKKRRASDRAA